MASFSVFVCVVVGSWLENAGGTVKNRNRIQTNFQSVIYPFKSLLDISSNYKATPIRKPAR